MQQVTRIEISKTFTGNHQNAQREVEYRTRLSQLLSSDICSISFSSGYVGVCFGVLCLCFALCSLLFSPHFSPFSSLSYKGLASLHFMCLLLLSEKGVRWALGGGKSTHTDTKKKKEKMYPTFRGSWVKMRHGVANGGEPNNHRGWLPNSGPWKIIPICNAIITPRSAQCAMNCSKLSITLVR